MALLGHVSPQMPLRCAALANGTVRGAYDAAMAKLHQRRPLPIVVAGRPVVPDRVEWLDTEMLKTRVAHGYCSRDLVAEACPYANICENCDNYDTTAEFLPQLQDQLADAHALHDDALDRGWESADRPPRPTHHQPAATRRPTETRHAQQASSLTHPRGPVNRLWLPEHDQLLRACDELI